MSKHENLLIQKFIEISSQVGTIVKVIPRESISISQTLTSIIRHESIVLISKFRFVESDLLKDYIAKNINVKINPTDQELSTAVYGITDSFAGIAETGSVCITNDDSMSGSYSLFTNTHIAILDSKNIVARPRDIFQKDTYKNISMNEDFIFVSGSSATADMGPLVRGVHGPGKLYVIILD